MSIWGALGGGVLDVLGGSIGGYYSYKGVKETNIANAKMAQQQMDFQERMANTAYQRSMADLRKAGLNPILAYARGGADSPSGASAVMQNALGSGVTTAMQAMRLREDLRSIGLQNEIVKASIPKAKAEEAYWKSWMGRMQPYIDNGSSMLWKVLSPLAPIFQGVSSAKQAFNALNMLKR